MALIEPHNKYPYNDQITTFVRNRGLYYKTSFFTESGKNKKEFIQGQRL